MKTKTILIGMWLLLIQMIRPVHAQNTCATDAVHQSRLQQDPSYAIQYQLMNSNVQNIVQGNQTIAGKLLPSLTATYNIPVVVHVVHLGEAVGTGTNVSVASINAMLADLNNRFANLNGNGVNMNVQFCLAVRDPNNNTTTGITRHNGSGIAGYSANGVGYEQPSPCGGVADSLIKDLSDWPCDKYYNIWIVKQICDAGGYSTLPWAVVPRDGIVIGAGSMTNGQLFAHETGHWLNLYHTFQGQSGTTCPPNGNCATDGDQVCDTPPILDSDCSTSTCSTGTITNSTFNYMGYCFSQWDRFTQGQKDRVTAALNTYPRNLLQNSLGCSPVTAVDAGITSIVTPALNTTYTTACAGASYTASPVVRLSNAGSSTLTSVSIKYRIDNNSASTYAWSGSLAAFSSTTVALPTLAIPQGTHTFQSYTTSPNGTTDGYSGNDSSSVSVIVNGQPAIITTPASTATTCAGNNGTATVTASGGTLITTVTDLSDFESTQTWTLVNGTQPNQYCNGTAAAYAGTKSLYISDATHNCADNNASGSQFATVHFYKDFTFPSNASNIQLSFTWRNVNGYSVVGGNWVVDSSDYAEVYLISTATTPVAGTKLVSGKIGGKYCNQGNWTTTTLSLGAVAGTTKRLAFTWDNNWYAFNPSFAADNITISYTLTAGYGYSWNTTPTQTTQTATGLAPGTYTCIVTDLLGCTKSQSATVANGCGGTVTISAGGATSFCQGNNVLLTSSLATGNVWNTAETTQSITVSAAGSYSCTNGGNTSNTIVVTVKPLPSATTNPTVSATLCAGGTVSAPVTGNAISLDGVDDYVTISNTISTAPDFTFECWIYPLANTVGQRLLDFSNSINSYMQCTVFDGSGLPRFGISNGAGTEQVIAGVTALSLNTWNHLAITLSGSSGKIYLNGTQIGINNSLTFNPTTIGATVTNQLGKSTLGGVGVNGYLDEVRFWNVARTQSQILANMNKTIPATTSGIVAYYKFDAGTGTSILESATGSTTGTTNNGAAWLVPSTVPFNAASYLWNTGATTQSVTPTSGGNYTVTVTAQNGCTAISNMVQIIGVNPVTPASITAGGSTTICQGSNITLTGPAKGNAISFDGINDYASPGVPMIPTSGNYTICFWAKESSHQTGYREIISQGRNFYIGRDNTGIIRLGDGWLNTGVSWPTDLLWHHYAVARGSSNTYFYMDGNLVATKGSAIGSPIVVGGAPNLFVIGEQWTQGTGEAFNGQVDDITIWNTVRSLAQVQTSMNSSVATTATGLVAYYKLDEGTGSSTLNAVNNADAATLTNGPVWVTPSTLPYNITGYLWSTSATTQGITVSTAATYKVTVTNSYGCTSTATKKIIVSNPTASFTKIGSLTLCGTTVTFTANSGTSLTYQWTKNSTNIPGATNKIYVASTAGVYKVIVTNSNGCSKLSAGKTVTECARLADAGNGDVLNLAVFPNPAEDNINVAFDGNSEKAVIKVVNINGQVMIEKEVSNLDGSFELSMDITRLSRGIYMIIVTTEGEQQTSKFVKQ